MRPPMQSTAALQQNEGNRQHLQQQQQQQQQQQHQQTLQPLHQHLITKPTSIDLVNKQQQQQQHISIKTTSQQHDFFVEHQLNFAYSTTTKTKEDTTTFIPLQRQQSQNHIRTQPQQHFLRKQQLNQEQQQSTDSDDSIQLVDLSTSPPHPISLLSAAAAATTTIATTQVVQPQITTHLRQNQHSYHIENLPQRIAKRSSSSISDFQYSRSSSSSEDGSLNSENFLQYSRASIFDDAAENFIINFPADSLSSSSSITQTQASALALAPPTTTQLPPLSYNQNDFIVNLPLSETEPLLTNIEATISDPQRSIRLNKNSASLIFTKKDIVPSHTKTTTTTRNNNCTRTTNPGQSTNFTKSHDKFRHHSSLRASNESSRKSSTKHLPPIYHHHHLHQQHLQQRRSLQLNYNNNLITTSTCGANNNYCCSSGSDFKSSPSSSSVVRTSNKIGGSSGSVLHKYHSGFISPGSANNTATQTRKQHAYSWYAPVYSALEEELEQDSRDSSPLHNLANIKKQHTTNHHYQHRFGNNLTASSTANGDNETVALLETRNHINIQAQLHANGGVDGNGITTATTKKNNATAAYTTAKIPSSLSLQKPINTVTSNNVSIGANVKDNRDYGIGGGTALNNYDVENSNAGSLELAGGSLPLSRRFKDFLKRLKPSSNGGSAGKDITRNNNTTHVINDHNGSGATMQQQQPPPPASPEITITRTPSEQNFVILRDPAGRVDTEQQQRQSIRKSDRFSHGSTSSLNVVQQKIWNILRREGSATSLNHEKSQSIVQYAGLRKCETVLALTRQPNSISPVFGNGDQPDFSIGNRTMSESRRRHISNGKLPPQRGSGVFNANGIEQIRPLNRLRSSATSMSMNTCSRCSSLLSLAATDSRYSLNASTNSGAGLIGGNNLVPSSTTLQHLQQARYQQSSQKLLNSCNSNNSIVNISNINYNHEHDSHNKDDNICHIKNLNRETIVENCSSSNCSRKSSAGANSTNSSNASSSNPPSNITTATLNSSSTPNTPATPAYNAIESNINTVIGKDNLASLSSIPTLTATSKLNTLTCTSVNALSNIKNDNGNHDAKRECERERERDRDHERDTIDGGATSISSTSYTKLQKPQTKQMQSNAVATLTQQQFEIFTCKLCLVDVETNDEATTLVQCGCQFCVECMRAYVEFEISEGAYEISCPDAQCPAQGILTLPEIANLTTTNLMKKHHRYRLNREIELDKTRTWCPRAGCETICQVGNQLNDATPSTSATFVQAHTLTNPETGQILYAVKCPSCKDEFCSSCKKVWHSNVTCEENMRRLMADGQDDIGIPFDNDLIKCCPMCDVPIEKDEGCAQMMCKRCKHVFCWYCLASLDDDFLLRHYDKGPCKNKLGHSRASVVWHRAQVIGIFAGFGILLLVASPLLLLAAPCIICCKCRGCSGSKVDEGDGEIDEATALQS